MLIHEFDIESREYTGQHYLYPLDSRGTNIDDFIMYDNKHGLVIERDNSQGDLTGFKAIYEIELIGNGQPVKKTLAVDLLNIQDPNGISQPIVPGDVGTGSNFAFPFTTIEDVLFFDSKHIGVLNDNNFPFSSDVTSVRASPMTTSSSSSSWTQPLVKLTRKPTKSCTLRGKSMAALGFLRSERHFKST